MKWWRGKRLNQPYWELWTGVGTRDPGPAAATSAVGLVDVASLAPPSSEPSFDRDGSCNGPSLTCPSRQFPLTGGNVPSIGPEEAAASVCTLTSEWEEIWKAIGFHPYCCSPLCVPAMGGLACASASQAQVCYTFPSGISKGAQRIRPRTLDTGIS